MKTKGIDGILIETHNWGATVAFWCDLGYEIEFETDHIGDAFLKLLQAVRFVREQSSTSINPNARTDGSPDDNQIM